MNANKQQFDRCVWKRRSVHGCSLHCADVPLRNYSPTRVDIAGWHLMVLLLKTCKALNGLLCADVPLRNYSLWWCLHKCLQTLYWKQCCVMADEQQNVTLKVKGQRSQHRHLHEHDQQRFTVRSVVLSGNDTRWRSTSSGNPLPEWMDFVSLWLQL